VAAEMEPFEAREVGLPVEQARDGLGDIGSAG
jgi:hypothetical protein